MFDNSPDKVKEPGVKYGYVPTEKQKQRSLFDFKPQRKEALPVRPAQRVRVATTGNIRAAGNIVTDASDVASLLSFIRKSPQEYLYTVATNENGLILEIHKYSKGQ